MLRIITGITLIISIYFGFNFLVNYMFNDYIDNMPYNMTVNKYIDRYRISWVTNNKVNCFLIYDELKNKIVNPSITTHKNNHYYHYSNIYPIIKDILYDFYISCVNNDAKYNTRYYYLHP
tara:strand:- start:6257 stop:6616 length:360 start_codon:yes stop_codon:yes gene_type:complete